MESWRRLRGESIRQVRSTGLAKTLKVIMIFTKNYFFPLRAFSLTFLTSSIACVTGMVPVLSCRLSNGSLAFFAKSLKAAA